MPAASPRSAARFTLDAMPGKQMAIDADLNSGLIDEDEARRRRARSSQEADFYGAMDGASKFVKGDAIAAIVITLINLIGGFVVGMVQRHLSHRRRDLDVQPADRRRRPGLADPRAADLDVDRPDRHPGHHRERHGHRPAAPVRRAAPRVQIAGGAIIALAMIPGLPKLPFLLVGGAVLRHRPAAAEAGRPGAGDPEEASAAALAAAPSPDSPESIARDMRVEPLELELAYDLIDLVDASTGGDLLDRVRALRRKLALELGIVIPLVRTRDNLDLPPQHLRDPPARRRGRPRRGAGRDVLAIGDDLGSLPGTVDPRAGLRPGRQVGAGRDAPAGRAHRRDRRRPRPR